MNVQVEPIVIRDLLTYCYPSSLAYNPSGTMLAFTLTRPNEEKNTYNRSVWGIREGKAFPLTFGLDASFVLWKDDETMMIRRRTRKDGSVTELFLLPVNGGEARPYLKLPFHMHAFHKITEDIYLAEGTIDANDPDAYLDTDEQKAEKKKKAGEERDYQVIDEVPYWHNGAGFTNKERNALFLVKVGEDTEVRRLSDAYENVSLVTVDGMHVYYGSETHTRKESRELDLKCLDVETCEIKIVYDRKDLGFGRLFVRDGELYGLAADRKEYGLNQTPDFVKIEHNHTTFLLDPKRSLNARIAGDTMLGSGHQFKMIGEDMITLATDEDHVALWKYDGEFRKEVLFDRQGALHFMDACSDRIAFAYADQTGPTEIYEMDLNGKHVRKLTNLNGDALKGKYVAIPEAVDFTSEGLKLRGWVLKPIHYDPQKKYPAVLDIHGGPRSVYGENFYHEMQVWASHGYFVFFANIAGSDGRDDAFADIRGKYGQIDYRNLMDFTDAVLEAYPAVDSSKLCVTGGSYGGFMTNWIITRTDRFCAAASQRSIANWISLSFIADIGLWFDPGECGIPYHDNILHHFDRLWDSSPLKYAQGVTTPTLFIHSDRDYRCPLSEGMQMMQALAYQNVETRMCIFHGENHELSRSGKPLHRMRRLQEITDWFDVHTKEKGNGHDTCTDCN